MSEMILYDVAISYNEVNPDIDLYKYFNLYPDIKLIIDKVDESNSTYDSHSKIVKLYSESYDVSNCATNIKYKTSLKNSCGQITFDLVEESCQKLFNNGDRVRLYLDNRCWFCGFIFTLNYSDKQKTRVTAFDFLRYFKSSLSYMKSELRDIKGSRGLTASEYIRKICSDLAIPCKVYDESTVPVTAQNYDMKSAFNIMEFAIDHTLINSSDRRYYTFYHESHFEQDDNKTNTQETQVYKNSGFIEFRDRRSLTTNVILDDSLLINYSFEKSIDKQTYNEVILYKDNKTYLSKTGKTLKKGKKTGTRTVKTASNNSKKAIWGYLPYYHKCPDSYTESQMQDVAKKLLDITCRQTHSISFESYGIIGLRAGYLLPVAIKEIAGTQIGQEKNGEFYPVFRTVTECEMSITHPLKMNVSISSAEFGEYDL